MRSLVALWLLSASAAVLLAANWYVRRPNNRLFTPVERRDPQSPAAVSVSVPKPMSSAAVSDERASSPLAAVPAPASVPAFDWSAVETSDYKQYAANLRAIGLPEELVRAIVIADVNAHYAPKEEALRRKQLPYDVSWAQREGSYGPSEWDRIAQLREVQTEKQAALKEILGIYVPREIVRTPRSQNYEAYEYALSLLPEEKRAAAQWIVEEEIIKDGKNHERYPNLGPEAVEAYRVGAAERDAALKQILTPTEFELYERNTTPCGTEWARQVIGMEPTEAEFAAMFRLAYKSWQDSGGVYGWWRAIPVASEQIAAAEREMQAGLQATLGPDRYLDYQMATSETGQQLRNLGARYDLPREALAQAFEVQKQLDALARQPFPDRQASLEQQLQQALGPAACQAWKDGRNRRVTLSP